MDMSFKRISGKWSKILFVVFHPKQTKSKLRNRFRIRLECVSNLFLVITLGRIITDTDTTDMYELGFKSFFRICSEVAQKPIQWRHLHNQGFDGTTVDMC